MPMYVRRTQSVQLNELTDRVAGKLAEHAGSRQIDLRNVRLWMTHSENPPPVEDSGNCCGGGQIHPTPTLSTGR